MSTEAVENMAKSSNTDGKSSNNGRVIENMGNWGFTGSARWSLCWFFLEVYLWMIIMRILASGVTSLSHPWVGLWVVVTDPGLIILENLIPPVSVTGVFFYDLPILLILLAIVFGKHLFD